MSLTINFDLVTDLCDSYVKVNLDIPIIKYKSIPLYGEIVPSLSGTLRKT